MVTIQTIENIKRGSKITLFSGIYAIFVGLFYIFFYNWIMYNNFRKIDSIWQIFTKYNPEISNFFFYLFLSKGLFIIALGICVIYLSIFIMRKKDKTAWVILFVIGLVFWAALLTIEMLTKNVYTISLSFIGWLIFIIGMIIPIKYYTQKSYDEY